MDEDRYGAVLAQLEYQSGQAELWRDAVSDWFLRASGIPDAKGRVGHHPGRIEAEAMELEGYKAIPIVPWEAASGGHAVSCAVERCTAAFPFKGSAGWYSLRVRYFDQPGGVARFGVRVNDQAIDGWTANDRNPARKMDASSSVLRIVQGVALRPGDRVAIEAEPGRDDPAGLDYVEVVKPEP